MLKQKNNLATAVIYKTIVKMQCLVCHIAGGALIIDEKEKGVSL